jgi:hypothetical protein
MTWIAWPRRDDDVATGDHHPLIRTGGARVDRDAVELNTSSVSWSAT